MNNWNGYTVSYNMESDYNARFLTFLDSYKNYTFHGEFELLQFLKTINSEFVMSVQKPDYEMWSSYTMNSHESQLSGDGIDYSWYLNLYRNPGVSSYTQTGEMATDQDSWWVSNNDIAQPRDDIMDFYDKLLKQDSYRPVSSRYDRPVIAKPPVPPPPREKKKVHIDVHIDTFQDLIDLIEKHPYDDASEYNIDLKSLHNVHDELKQINSMIGLKEFKNDLLDQLLYFVQGLHENTEPDYKHLVIYGPPGTGKTQIAKLVGQMYSKLGILKNGVFKKVTRTDLVAGYLGQTAIKTNKVIQECLGGVLFIDEVYSLGCGATGGAEDNGLGDCGDSYSKECIDTLCEALSNYKSNLMVIVAGYERDVQRFFFSLNSGLSSRFIWRFTIKDYTANELKDIFLNKVADNGWKWRLDSEDITKSRGDLDKWFTKKHSLGVFKYFGRDMEQLFTYCKIAHGRRIYGLSADEKRRFTMKDLDNGYDIFMKHTDDNKKKEDMKFRERYCGLYL